MIDLLNLRSVEDNLKPVETRAKQWLSQTVRTHGIEHHWNARSVALGRRAHAVGQWDKRHELHKRRIATSGAAVKQVLASLSSV